MRLYCRDIRSHYEEVHTHMQWTRIYCINKHILWEWYIYRCSMVMMLELADVEASSAANPILPAGDHEMVHFTWAARRWGQPASIIYQLDSLYIDKNITC